MTFNLRDSYGMLMHQIRWRRNRSRREKKCWLRKDVRGGKDGSKVQSCLWWRGETVCLRVLCHLCLEIKERRKKITYRALVSFLWQPEDYYHTLPFIMKGLALTGSKTGRGEERGGQCAAFSLLSAGRQKEKEWMSLRKTPLGRIMQECPLTLCSDNKHVKL